MAYDWRLCSLIFSPGRRSLMIETYEGCNETEEMANCV